MKPVIETSASRNSAFGGELISAGWLTFSVLNGPVNFHHIFVDYNPLLGFIWTVPRRGERKAGYRGKYQKKKKNREASRCERKGEKSVRRG